LIAAGKSTWSDFETWEGDGLRREVFFFSSGDTELYGSLYVATELSRPFGVLACNSWGVEADRCDPLQRSVALGMAKLGGAGMVFHYPGYGDSLGSLDGLGLADLEGAACDAVAEASRRCPGVTWLLAGFMLGASVACLAQRQRGLEPLLLVQPALRPGAYFRRLARRTEPLAPGPAPRELMEVGNEPGMAYGYPLPASILGRADEADAAVEAALRAFSGEGVVVSHLKPDEVVPVPDRFRRIDVAGAWRFGTQNNPKLAAATLERLERHAPGGER